MDLCVGKGQHMAAGKARRSGTHFLLIGFPSSLLGADASGGGVDAGDVDSRSFFVRATGIAAAGAVQVRVREPEPEPERARARNQCRYF